MSFDKLKTLALAEIQVQYSNNIKSSDRVKITCSKDAERAFREIWEQPIQHRESFYVLFLDRSSSVLGFFLVSLGGVSGTVVDQKLIFQTALKVNACSIIAGHNHPSGNLEPSQADINITRKIKESGELLDIPLLDHLIICQEYYRSLADDGYL
ncbi:JAB domain-containing protein [uncultured Draconibacterium sp.]|uniref:JAB domain-containing protein n=1 Tax=uncultured Draconibacterium sp. TaxID=1573823 RepID=UPI0032169DA5